jgi:hypothetical protein
MRRDRSESRSWYDTAQICVNGHLINAFADSSPERNSKFCQKCGARTVMACEQCNTKIRGYYHVSGAISLRFDFPIPKNCYECGAQYPWAVTAIESARALVDELQLSAEDKATLQRDVDDLIQDSPRTEVAAMRAHRILSKANEGAIDMFANALLNVTTDLVQRRLKGQP